MGETTSFAIKPSAISLDAPFSGADAAAPVAAGRWRGLLGPVACDAVPLAVGVVLTLKGHLLRSSFDSTEAEAEPDEDALWAMFESELAAVEEAGLGAGITPREEWREFGSSDWSHRVLLDCHDR